MTAKKPSTIICSEAVDFGDFVELVDEQETSGDDFAFDNSDNEHIDEEDEESVVDDYDNQRDLSNVDSVEAARSRPQKVIEIAKNVILIMSEDGVENIVPLVALEEGELKEVSDSDSDDD